MCNVKAYRVYCVHVNLIVHLNETVFCTICIFYSKLVEHLAWLRSGSRPKHFIHYQSFWSNDADNHRYHNHCNDGDNAKHNGRNVPVPGSAGLVVGLLI